MKNEKILFKSGVNVDKKRNRIVREVAGSSHRCHGTMLMLQADVIHRWSHEPTVEPRQFPVKFGNHT